MRVGINGFGRIGRLTLRTALQRHPEIEIAAVNDLFDVETAAHLLRHDSTYGAFPGTVAVENGDLLVDGRPIAFTAQKDWTRLGWGERGVDVVIESTGFGTARAEAVKHLAAGARKVIISAPAKGEDVTLVLGVNQDTYDPEKHHIISNASCTTNGLAPVVKVIRDELGLIKGMMTTVHAYTNSQKILDVAAKDLREARAGALNIVPTSTGAARAVGLVIPEVRGILDGLAYRVPTPTVSIVELVALTERDTTADEVNATLRRAAAGPMRGILAVTDEPLVSMDLKGNEYSSIVDSLVTNVVGGNLVKVAAWYDNEWGYACRIADLTALVGARLPALAAA
ncbi:MAG TPA: type I glyceraldehyde-3-phosphate dehydrogenase [Chloroflexota bacterium]|nr:type I glyceraldehyde-3-phosphate dehydrogenase [Chloroflexota bacterium]